MTVPKKPTVVNIASTNIEQEEPVFFDNTDQHETTEEELWKRKRGTLLGNHKEPQVIKVSCCYSNSLHKDTTNVNIAQLPNHHG